LRSLNPGHVSPILGRSTKCFESPIGSIRGYPGGRLKALKRRRLTVKTIGKITNTMKVVASSKLGPATAKAKAISPFFLSVQKTMAGLAQPNSSRKVLTLVVCTDKGLCGATNNGMTRALLKEDLSGNTIVVWGDKGCAAFERSRFKLNVAFSAHPSQKHVLSYLEIASVVDKIMKQEFDYLRVVFNRMKTASSSEVDNIYVPSFNVLTSEEGRQVFAKYETEATNSEEMYSNMAEFLISSAVTYAAFHNQAVEMFARRNSMDNASKNAEKVQSELYLKYNRERQAIITTELGEITSGAAAVAEGSQKQI